MLVHLFGATSSPSVCNYALKRIVNDNQLDPSVASTITRHFYVDDCLRSVPSEEAAIQLIQDLVSACHMGGFHLSKFMSNSRKVLETVNPSELCKDVQSIDIRRDDLPVELVLGVQWCATSDKFKFSVSVSPKPTTRRGILSTICSIFDPLGFVAPFILKAKQMLQSLCKKGTHGWDDEIPEDYVKGWNQWLRDLTSLEHVEVDRCLKPPGFGKVKSRQIHVFSDASTSGYGAVAYLRLQNTDDMIWCSFLMGKARLAPVKHVTIPRLELTAATVAVNLGQLLVKELSIEPDSVTYHTDSTTVLHYINSEGKRFPVFVANRVQTIRDYSRPSQWRYVGTSDNPADDGSRGVGASQVVGEWRWLTGPSFLRQPEIEWPEQPSVFVQESNLAHADMADELSTRDTDAKPFDALIGHYSDWYRLSKAVAYFMGFRDFLSNKRGTTSRDENLSLCKK